MIAAQPNASHMIPVTDERLEYHPKGNKEQKAKIDAYNDMVEDVYERKVELVRMEETLIDMRREILEENAILSGVVQVPAEESESEKEEESGEQVLSDSGSSDKSGDKAAKKAEKKKTGFKSKAKSKGRERTKVGGARMDVDWDYRLDVAAKLELRDLESAERAGVVVSAN
ncbi:hypothetical protein BDQ17DRAFT_1543435 [Cyathus striatus]|nr:hypothetical protein BDQ17DRAFT_1543435 [Cyathus striatus]